MFNDHSTKTRSIAIAVAGLMTVVAFASAPGAFAATPSQTGYVDASPAGDPPAVYPEEALESGRSGYATVKCTIGTDGKTSDCSVISTRGSAQFGSSALDFARSESFHPATLNGAPVKTSREWRVNFSAD